MMIRETSKVLLVALLVLATLALPACQNSAYVLRGRVVDGVLGDVAFVTPDTGLLTTPGVGVASANIVIHRDAGRPNQRRIATGRSGADGEFSIPIGEFGVGWMQESWLIQIVKPGYERLEVMVDLPSSGQNLRTLITLRTGYTAPSNQPSNPWDDYEKFK